QLRRCFTNHHIATRRIVIFQTIKHHARGTILKRLRVLTWHTSILSNKDGTKPRTVHYPTRRRSGFGSPAVLVLPLQRLYRVGCCSDDLILLRLFRTSFSIRRCRTTGSNSANRTRSEG